MIRLSDVVYSLRLWRRHPTLVAVAGLSLGLGVGATTTMYSVVNRVSNYQLGFADADRLAVLWNTDPDHGANQLPPDLEIVQAVLERGRSFEAFGLFQGNGAPVTLSGTSETGRVLQMPVDVNALAIVGVKPTLGRTYRLEDFNDLIKQKEARAIVVSYDTWQRRLGRRARRDRDHDPGGRRVPHRDRRDAQGLRARPLGRRHRLLGGQRPAQDPAGALDDGGRAA